MKNYDKQAELNRVGIRFGMCHILLPCIMRKGHLVSK